jgi:alpha-galactosidase
MVEDGPVKVFILAGQSNMQGHASLRTLEYLIYDQATAATYQQWKDRDGRWTERRDVWIWTTDGNRSGNLRPGFGVNEIKLGPELGFGWLMGEHLPEQVLLIKTCWGGRSVRCDFLPPSADKPAEAELLRELENRRKRDPDATLEDVRSAYGWAYREMIFRIKTVLGDLTQHFPHYDERRGTELTGFVFFQGWNDMVDGTQREEDYVHYTERLALLIEDLRKDLDSPALPVVIGELGVGGRRGSFQAAQAAVATSPEFAGNVAFCRTAEFWEPEVEEMVNKGTWKGPDWVEFYNVGSERAYHYLGSARLYSRIGNALAEEMIRLMDL